MLSSTVVLGNQEQKERERKRNWRAKTKLKFGSFKWKQNV
jgi:hypothetical protein